METPRVSMIILGQTTGPGAPTQSQQTYIGNMNATTAGYGVHALVMAAV